MIEGFVIWVTTVIQLAIVIILVTIILMVLDTICGARIRKVWRDFLEVIQWARDRYWFYYVIDGDEFHPSLNLDLKKCMKGMKYHKKEQERIIRDRRRAHKLDAIYNGYSKGMVL